MKTLYIECNMGAAGDMLMAALAELHPDIDGFIEKLNKIGIPKVKAEKKKTIKCGIIGTSIKVFVDGTEESETMYSHNHCSEHNHVHEHSSMFKIKDIINNLDVSENVKKNAISVYEMIAAAESHAHGRTIENIHFHEVGTMDAICDIVGCCMLMEEINPDKIIASPINVGRGEVKCAHGILHVPAPAVVYILKGTPVYSSDINGELCTLTGAALLKHFVSEFKNMPLMEIEKIGYGMGTRDYETINCVRAFIGKINDENKDKIAELSCNIDDMTGEQIGYAFEKIMNSGARDIFTTAIEMKKNRPGIMLTCICGEDKKENVLNAIFKYTSTIGVRENICSRYILEREEIEIETNYGTAAAKKSTGFGVTKIKGEYENLAEIANKYNIPITDIKIKV